MKQTRYHQRRNGVVWDDIGLPENPGKQVQTSPVPSLSRTEVSKTRGAKTVPCFVAGTRIVTQSGLVVIEDLKPGDRILTRDNGYQDLRWIGTSSRRASGADSPVKIAASTLGNHEAICLSQNHRVLVQSPAATMLFGESEVLIRA
ncbi:MAG: hypothetical protein GY904_36910 [Planctomycetaceae bacterium]|nr:hypothetical protein [Planctomycetaceae bacterium]